jgi:protein involved in polysaccharide export with SLBB domain
MPHAHNGVTPLLLSAAYLLGAMVLPAAAEPYRLVPQDRIALRVVEWRSGEAEFKDWSALNGTFMVNDDGAVSVPLVGEVPAAGLTTRELSGQIALLLQQRVGMTNKPSAAVEIAQYGPIYVAGAVDKPGEYQFSPDLTVMKAVSLAGGLERQGETGIRLERENIQATGLLHGAELEYRSLLMRRARLEAEKEGRPGFDIPPQLRGEPGIEQLHAEELVLMKLRRKELESKIAAARGIGSLYEHEIQTLQNKINTQQRQVDLVKKELASVSALLDKGLVQSSRRLSLDRDESDEESKLLDLGFQLLRARQLLEENNRDADELVNSMNSQVQTELNTVVHDIAKAGLQAKVSGLLINETADEKQRRLLDRNEDEKPIRFQIARRGRDGSIVRIEASADADVEPRDLIEVIGGPARAKISTTSTEAGSSNLTTVDNPG